MSSEDFDESELVDCKSKQIAKMVLRKEIATTSSSLLIESLVKNLCTLIEKDHKEALKLYNYICSKFFDMKLIDESYNMTEFESLRTQYQRALYHLVTAARGTDEPLKLQQFWSSNFFDTEFSHYYRQFEELEFIAGGGFGQVFKVRHKLDGIIYAIKKIYICANVMKSVMNYLTEVKTFACLNHHNIVQYKNAWLELGVHSNQKAIELPESSYSATSVEDKIVESESFRLKNHDSSEFTVQFESNSKHSHSVRDLENIYSKSNNKSSFECCESEHNSEIVNKFNGNTRNSTSNPEYSVKFCTNSRNSISEGGKAICKFNITEQLHNYSLAERNWATLYIQMSLCQITLKQWLEERNETEKSMEPLARLQLEGRREIIFEILRQMLKGLEYIHSKGIVHHDVKPSNVFIQNDGENMNVQLGDFGLACPLQCSQHSLAFGTKLYAAPEQLAGKCDRKSDMYSLGIILLELLDSYQTDMERIQNITELRCGRLPSYISAADPFLAGIIKQLVTEHPQIRPVASELLARLSTPFFMSEQPSDEIMELKSKLNEREAEVMKLKALLKEKGVEIE